MAGVVLPTPAFRQDERAALDFVQTVKLLEDPDRGQRVRTEFSERAAEYRRVRGTEPATIADVAAILDESTTWKYDRALWRFTQEMMYGRIRENLLPEKEALIRFLEAPVERPIGTLRLQPDLPMPHYFTADFHCQPGGMFKDRLVPFVTAISNDVFSGGRSRNFEWQDRAAEYIRPGDWRRILDLGCGFKSPIVLKRRFPQAEIFGIDLSAPLVQYGHKLAESLGLAVHLSQQNAEQTDFSSGHFDVVFSTILFHEVPDDAALRIIREGYRLLAPGGWFVIDDTPTYDRLTPFAAYQSDWMTANNVEPFWTVACRRDYPALLRAAGFEQVLGPGEHDGYGVLPARVHRARK